MDLNWCSLSNFFNRGKRRSFDAQRELIKAYRTVFRSQEGQVVLSDLANKSGFYKATLAHGSTDREIWQTEGKRLLFAEIFALLNLSDTDLRALEYAARREAAVDADPSEGNFNDD